VHQGVSHPDREGFALVPRNTYASEGCLLGCLLAVALWIFPIPVAVIVWLLDLKGLFADYMYMTIPFLAALPLIGGGIGLLIRRRPGSES
jgi:hypothetical protein